MKLAAGSQNVGGWSNASLEVGGGKEGWWNSGMLGTNNFRGEQFPLSFSIDPLLHPSSIPTFRLKVLALEPGALSLRSLQSALCDMRRTK